MRKLNLGQKRNFFGPPEKEDFLKNTVLSIEMASALSAWLWHISALEPWLYVEPNGSKWLWGYLYGHPKVSVDQKTYFLEMF